MCSKTLQQARRRICADEEKGPIKNIPTRVSYATGVSPPPSISSPAGANTLLYLAQQLFPKRRVPRQPGHVSGGCWRGREDTAGTKQMPWLSAARGLCLGGSLLPWLLFLFLIIWLGAWAWFPSLSTACSGNNEGRHSRNRRRQRRQRSEPDSTTFSCSQACFSFFIIIFKFASYLSPCFAQTIESQVQPCTSCLPWSSEGCPPGLRGRSTPGAPGSGQCCFPAWFTPPLRG